MRYMNVPKNWRSIVRFFDNIVSLLLSPIVLLPFHLDESLFYILSVALVYCVTIGFYNCQLCVYLALKPRLDLKPFAGFVVGMLHGDIIFSRASNYSATTRTESTGVNFSDSPRLEMKIKGLVSKNSRPYLFKKKHLTSSFGDVISKELAVNDSVTNEIGNFFAATDAINLIFEDGQTAQHAAFLTPQIVKRNPSPLLKVATVNAVNEDHESKDELWKYQLTPYHSKPMQFSTTTSNINNRSLVGHDLQVNEKVVDDNQFETLISDLERDARLLSARQKSPMQKINRPSFTENAVAVSMEESVTRVEDHRFTSVMVSPGRRREGAPGSPLGPGTRAELLLSFSVSKSEKHDKNNAHMDKFSSHGRQRIRASKNKVHRGPGSQLYTSPSIT
eukprot:CAMPEP_0170081758 /NCGR_PEP_ID=MMETSP0019_2-20121128/17537_1 /TAXON_ID=98059 /ORGANISM="Dinobryon sp., Strain UTEXLB2267" /LENGTH=389 /DNA_ID=CAMNT_0010296331 /DNA_START=76 /DNA_END=1245 /DNA_ORIENTATION=+